MLTLNKWDLGNEGWNAGIAKDGMLSLRECWIVGMGYWDESYGMLDFRGRMLDSRGE